MRRKYVQRALWALPLLLGALALRASAAPKGGGPPGRTVYQYACGGWSPEEPKAKKALFDVYFGRQRATDPDDGPSQAQREAIENLGGRIVYEYHVPMVRARLRVEAVGLLEANFVRSVSKPQKQRHVVDAIIGIPVPLSDLDREFLEDLGVIISRELGFGAVSAIVPDESIPAIRSHEGVRYLEVNGIGACLD